MKKFISELNREYLRLVKVLLSELDDTQAINSLQIRRNAPRLKKFTDRLKNLREKLAKNPVFENIFEAMSGVFQRVDRGIVDEIKKTFKSKRMPIPELQLRAEPQALREAIKLNVELINAIKNKQIENLENTVLSVVTGGLNRSDLIDEINRQSDRGQAYAEFVARDQISKTVAAVNKERQSVAGFPGYIWRVTKDSNVRPAHKELHNTYNLWSQPPLVKGVGNQPDRNLHPGEDYQCRCHALPAFGPAIPGF